MNGHRKRYHTIPLRRRAQQTQERQTTRPHAVIPAQPMPVPKPHSSVTSRSLPVQPDEDEQYLPVRSHTSALRWTDTQGNEVLQQGKQRLVIHRGKPKRRVHWVFPAGMGMLATLLLWFGGQWAVTTAQTHTLDSTYGNPRYWQTDQVLGIDGDSPVHKTHLVFQNLNGHVFFIVIPAGNIAKASIYPVATLYGSDASNWPVTATFQDVNGDGKIDVIVEIDNQQMIFLNTGTGFKPQQ